LQGGSPLSHQHRDRRNEHGRHVVNFSVFRSRHGFHSQALPGAQHHSEQPASHRHGAQSTGQHNGWHRNRQSDDGRRRQLRCYRYRDRGQLGGHLRRGWIRHVASPQPASTPRSRLRTMPIGNTCSNTTDPRRWNTRWLGRDRVRLVPRRLLSLLTSISRWQVARSSALRRRLDNGGRSETVQIVDAVSGNILDTRTLTAFTNGVYLVWNISGKVVINISQNSGSIVSSTASFSEPATASAFP